jgi:hypothetical protein
MDSFRIAVPIFFLINGYFFSDAIENKKVNKWIIRVFILYFVWVIFYSFLWFKLSVKSIFISVFIGQFHLWYINAMLLSGILLCILKKMNPKNMLILIFILFSIGVLLQYIGNYNTFEPDIRKTYIYIHRNFLFLGFPFFAIGYLIKIKKWHKRITPKQTIFLISLGALFLCIESYINFYYTKKGIDNLFSLIFTCPFIFMYAINSNLKYNINSKNIALVSTAIYLIHPWVMNILNTIFELYPTTLSLLTVIFSLVASLIIIKINNKIKFLL